MKAIRELIVFPLLVAAFTGVAAAQTNELPRIAAADATNYMGIQVVVTGKVVQVVHRATVVLLNLNQKYPDSPLTCVIRGSDTNMFPDVEKHLGRQVEVTGRIIDYQGRPEIILTDTNQIMLVDAPSINASPAPPATEPAAVTSPATTPTTLTSPVEEPAPKAADKPDRATWWIVGSLAVIIALLGILVFLFWRRDPGKTLQPGSATALIGWKDEADAAAASVDDWKQRALVAEAMAGQQGQLLREKIMPELTEFAKQSLVQGLYAQRNALLEKQQKAQQAVAELERRLTVLQLPLHDRIRAYEKRVAELETEVETQGDEMRELTRTTLELLRRKLEDERGLERSRRPLN